MTNEKNLLIFGLVAVAALWLMSQGRRAVNTVAPPGVARPVPGAATGADRAAGLGALFGGLGSLLSPGAVTAGPSRMPREIVNDDLPGQAGWGWNYYDNGTAIGPDGAYYFQGERVWAPDSIAANVPSVMAYHDTAFYGGAA